MKLSIVRSTILWGLLMLMAGACSMANDTASPIAAPEEPLFPEEQAPVIEESDIYRQSGHYLYVQNNQTGLNILDTSLPDRPRLVGRTTLTSGSTGEMYIREQTVIILLETATSSCRNPENLEPGTWQINSEMVLVDVNNKTAPLVTARYCLPGTLVDSRVVGEMLYIVTTKAQCGSRAMSINIADPSRAQVINQMDFPNASKEILVTAEAIFVTGMETGTTDMTRVQYISINAAGQLQMRGSFLLTGAPQGRFHMDATSGQFRIVTFESRQRKSQLFILDLSNPDNLELMGSLTDIGHGEQLYATRFDGDRAYVVTFRQTDPLWIISLEDPTQPRIMGELHVPGWSDFIFPRGNRLLTVGRGDRGNYLAVSLFDVSNPTHPIALSQVSLGDPGSTSEANVDHRAVTIIEMPEAPPLVVVPHTRVNYYDQCVVYDQLDLVEVSGDYLHARGIVLQQGTIRRTMPISDYLYSISDYEVLAVDISNRDYPTVLSSVTLGNQPVESNIGASYCQSWQNYSHWENNSRGMVYDDSPRFLCSLGQGQGVGFPPTMVLMGLLLVVLRFRRPKNRS